MTILVKEAFVYIDGGFVKNDVLIKNGRIDTIGYSISVDGVDRVFYAKDKYLFPGFVDVHVHLREPGFSYKETIKSGSMSAASAGYTDICAMPNLDPVPDSIENIGVELDIIKRDAVINVHPYASITVGRKGGGELVDFESLSDLAVAFSDDGTGIQNGEDMKKAMQECARLGKIIAAHCEVNDLLNGGYIHDGKYCREHGHRGISSASEYEQVARDVELARETGVHYHVCHVSTKESVDIIRKAKAEGVNVTCETAPHYLVLTDDDIDDDGRYKMNPPLRTRDDMAALCIGVLDGTIDIIATDHAPHSVEEKCLGLEGSLMGVVGLETAFPLIYTAFVVPHRLSLAKVIELMCVRPRKIFGLGSGLIAEGEIANLSLYDLKDGVQVIPDNFVSKGRSTPFDGWYLAGKNKLTICKGEIVYEAL